MFPDQGKLIKENDPGVRAEYAVDGQSYTPHCLPVIASFGFAVVFTESELLLIKKYRTKLWGLSTTVEILIMHEVGNENSLCNTTIYAL